MIYFPDSSFLYAWYLPQQQNSALAIQWAQTHAPPLSVYSLVLYEFRQSLRLQQWLHGKGIPPSLTRVQLQQADKDLQSDLNNGVIVVVPVDWQAVISDADQLSLFHTSKDGNRALDILHVSTARFLGADEFLTFDSKQRQLAIHAGLIVAP